MSFFTMGQNMSTATDLTHAIKKMRLTPSDGDGNNLPLNSRDHANSLSVGRVSSPSSPFHKLAGRDKNMLAIAVNAPFESISTADEFDLPEPHVFTGENGELENCIASGSESPSLTVAEHSSCELITTSISNETKVRIIDDLSNDDIIAFLRNRQRATIIRTTSNMNGTSVDCPDEVRMLQPAKEPYSERSMPAKYSEPSIEDFIRHFNRT